VRGTVLLLAFPAFGLAQGPIETRNGRAASLAFLRLDPRGTLLGPGERSLGLSLMSANSLTFLGAVREDQETERLALRARWGVARGEWGVEVPLLARWGGFMDPFLAGFHRLVGIHNFRGSVPFGRSEERLPGSGGFASEAGLGDVTGSYSRAVGRRTFVTFALKLPTGNAGGLLGSGAVDAGASLYSRWGLGHRFELFGQLGAVVQGDPTRLASARPFVHQESLSLQYRKDSRDYWVVQWQGEPSAMAVGVRKLDGPHRMLSLGFTRRLSGRESIQLFLSEDADFVNYRAPLLVNVAPDFSIGLNLTRRW